MDMMFRVQDVTMRDGHQLVTVRRMRYAKPHADNRGEWVDAAPGDKGAEVQPHDDGEYRLTLPLDEQLRPGQNVTLTLAYQRS